MYDLTLYYDEKSLNLKDRPKLKLNSGGILFIDPRVKITKIHYYEPSVFAKFIDKEFVKFYSYHGCKNPYTALKKIVVAYEPQTFPIRDSSSIITNNYIIFSVDWYYKKEYDNKIAPHWVSPVYMPTISQYTGDCGSYAIKNMNTYLLIQFNEFEAIVKLYHFLMFLETELLSRAAWICFSQYDFKKYNDGLLIKNPYGHTVPKLNMITQLIAECGGHWTPSIHPNYEFEQIGNDTTTRNHYHGLLTYRGLKKFYEQHFDKLLGGLPNIFPENFIIKA